MNNKLQCGTCACKPVCGECEAWGKYVEQHHEMRKISASFDNDPKCRYYVSAKNEVDNTNYKKQKQKTSDNKSSMNLLESVKDLDLSKILDVEVNVGGIDNDGSVTNIGGLGTMRELINNVKKGKGLSIEKDPTKTEIVAMILALQESQDSLHGIVDVLMN